MSIIYKLFRKNAYSNERVDCSKSDHPFINSSEPKVMLAFTLSELLVSGNLFGYSSISKKLLHT